MKIITLAVKYGQVAKNQETKGNPTSVAQGCRFRSFNSLQVNKYIVISYFSTRFKKIE